MGKRHVACASFKVGASLLAIASVMPNSAIGQDTPSQQVSDEADARLADAIIVTARRRAEDVQDVPISLTALSGDALKERNLPDLQALNGFIPNVTIGGTASFGSTQAAFSIRGSFQDSPSITLEPAVGLYVDGVYLGRSESGLVRFSDIERIEVLRGPQGTLFGKNTAGGAISIVSRRPEPGYSGEISLTGGSFDRAEMEGIVNLELKENLFFRASGYHAQRDGHVLRLTDEIDVGDTNTTGGRAQLRWEASDTLTVDLSADYSSTDRNGSALVATSINPNALFPTLMENFNPGVNPPYDSRWVPADIGRQTWASGPTFHELESWGFSGEVNWDLGGVSFKSLTAYRGYDLDIALDGDGTPVRMFESRSQRTFWQFSQELQLSGEFWDDRINWVAGLFYFQENPEDERSIAQRGVGSFANVEQFSYDQNTKSYAAFGQATIDITDRLSATAGLRYTYDDKTLILAEPTRFPNVVVTAPIDFDSITPRFDVQYDLTQDIMAYASYTRGYKGGGLNDRIIGVTGGGFTFLPFEDETSTNYEVGLKSELFDRMLRFNAAFFWSKYKNMQQAINTTDPVIPNRSLILTENIGEADVKGLELDFVARPTANLTLNGAFGWLDSEIVELDAGSFPGFVVGERLGRSPEISFSVGGQYSIDLPKGDRVDIRADYNWQDDFVTTTSIFSAVPVDSYGLLSARIAYVSPEDRWSIALFGTNLTDEFYINNGLNIDLPFGFVQIEPGRPREIGIRLEANF